MALAAAVKVAVSAVKVLLVARSMVKPVWLLALLVQVRLIWAGEAAVAVRPLGAAGTELRRASQVYIVKISLTEHVACRVSGRGEAQLNLEIAGSDVGGSGVSEAQIVPGAGRYRGTGVGLAGQNRAAVQQADRVSAIVGKGLSSRLPRAAVKV